MPAIIEKQDKRAWLAAIKIWDYARQHSQRLSSQDPIRQIEAAILQATANERQLHQKSQEENVKLRWIIGQLSRQVTLHRKGVSNRNMQYDGEIVHAYQKLGVDLGQLATAFRASKTVMRKVLEDNGVNVNGEY